MPATKDYDFEDYSLGDLEGMLAKGVREMINHAFTTLVTEGDWRVTEWSGGQDRVDDEPRPLALEWETSREKTGGSYEGSFWHLYGFPVRISITPDEFVAAIEYGVDHGWHGYPALRALVADWKKAVERAEAFLAEAEKEAGEG